MVRSKVFKQDEVESQYILYQYIYMYILWAIIYGYAKK